MNKNFTEDLPWDLLAKCVSGNADLNEQKLLENWLTLNQENEALYREIQKIWNNEYDSSIVDSEKSNEKREFAWKKLKNKIDSVQREKKPLTFRLNPILIAASMVGIIVLGYFTYSAFTISTENINLISVYNDKTEPLNVVLPDGSNILLNKDSKLSYPEKFKNRTVELEGEAFFNVIHQPKNKFVVNATDLSVEVIGTAFNLNAHKGKNARLMVETGKVLFKTTDNNLTLSAGQGALLDIKTKKINSKADINAFAWKTKMLKFQNSTLSEIIETLESNFNTKIKVNNKELLKCEFNGVFEKTQPELILQAMAFSLGLKVNNENGFYVLDGEGCNKN